MNPEVTTSSGLSGTPVVCLPSRSMFTNLGLGNTPSPGGGTMQLSAPGGKPRSPDNVRDPGAREHSIPGRRYHAVEAHAREDSLPELLRVGFSQGMLRLI